MSDYSRSVSRQARAEALHDVVFKERLGSSNSCHVPEARAFIDMWSKKLGSDSPDLISERLALEGLPLIEAEERLSNYFESALADEFESDLEGNLDTLEAIVTKIALAGMRSVSLHEGLISLVDQLESSILASIEERIWYWLPHFQRNDRVSFHDFPVLERLLWHEATRSAGNLIEMLTRWDLDRRLVGGLIGDKSADATDLIGFEANRSEPHDHGRSVAILTLRGGKVVYKPRFVGFECRFQDLLKRLSQGLAPSMALPTIGIIDRGNYGWFEFVDHADFDDTEQASNCHCRLGFLMAVIYGLGGVDLIQDNVIIGSGGPVLVDAETMLQPLSCPAGSESIRCEVLAEVEAWRSHSVIETGALPIWGRRGNGGGFRNIGLTGPVCIGSATAVSAMSHQIRIRGEICDSSDYLSFILEGFSSGYQRMIELRESLLGGEMALSALFAGCVVRYLPRPSATYGQLIYRMMSPDALRSGLSFGLEAEVLLKPFFRLSRFEGKPSRWDLTRKEIACLTALEVPCFQIGVSEASDPWILLSAIDYAAIQLKGLGDLDLERQSRLIRVGLSIRPAVTAIFQGSETTVAPRLIEESPGSTHLIEMACELGERILRFSASPEALHSYAKYDPSRNQDQRIATSTVYGGRIGRALFFQELGRVTAECSFTDFAVREAVESAALVCRNNWEDALGCGGTGGLGGILFGYAAILGGDVDAGIVERWFGKIEKLILRENILEFDRGLAGSVMALLGGDYGHHTGRAVDLAQMAGERIWMIGSHDASERDWEMVTDGFRILGFAHGYAGIAASFSRLFRVTGDKVWKDRCLFIWNEIFRFGLSEGSEGWPAAVSESSGRLDSPPDAWCAGSPGIALAHTEMVGNGIPTLDPSPALLNQAAPSSNNDSVDFLCCGKAGKFWVQAEILKRNETALSSVRSDWEFSANSDFMRIYKTARTREECLLHPSSLFRGLSGIGLTHLRLVDPSTINVLTLALPRS